jgi:WD40 repeat protein
MLSDFRTGQRTDLNLKYRQPGDAAFSPDGKLVALACKFGFARVWETATWREVATLSDFLKGVHSLAWSPDGRRLAVASGDREAIKLWDVENREELMTLPGVGGTLAETAFSADGKLLGSLDPKGVLQIWRAPSWPEIEAAEAK